MLRLIERSRDELRAFTEQRVQVMRVVRCRDEDTAIVLKLLDELDQTSTQDLYLSFAVPFVEPQTFVDQLVDDFEQRHALVCSVLKEEQRAPLLPVPTAVRDPRRSPQGRLRALLEFSRSLLPEGGRCVVFALVPSQIVDRAAYHTLVTAITPQRELEAWMPRVRVVLRDNPVTAESSHPLVALAPTRSACSDFDFGTEALGKDLHESMEDESLPPETRVQGLFTLALIDGASARSELAIERLTYLLSYFQSTKNALMQGMVLNAMGDVFSRVGDPVRAQEWYESAVPPASESQNPVLLSILARNLGNAQLALGNLAEARAYFVELDRVATHMVDAETKSAALYARGLCDRRQGNALLAIQSFEAGATLCRGTDQPKELCGHLEQLRDVYSEQGLSGKAGLAEEERTQVASSMRSA
ncbi:hypothetical protein ACFL5O_06915 [Myxococcota bacterium]